MAGRSVGGCLPRLPTNDSRWKMRAVDLFSQSPCLPMFLPTESVFHSPLSVLLTFFFSISFPFLLLNRAIIYGPILFYTSISLSHTKDCFYLLISRLTFILSVLSPSFAFTIPSYPSVRRKSVNWFCPKTKSVTTATSSSSSTRDNTIGRFDQEVTLVNLFAHQCHLKNNRMSSITSLNAFFIMPIPSSFIVFHLSLKLLVGLYLGSLVKESHLQLLIVLLDLRPTPNDFRLHFDRET